MKALLRISVVFFSAIMISGSLYAQTAAEKAAFDKVVASACSMKNMTADFTETKHLDMLSQDVVTKGKLWYMAPSYMRWEYDNLNYGVYNPKTAYMVKDGQRNGALSRGFSQAGRMITQLMGGLGQNLKDYEISYVKEGKDLKVTAVPVQERYRNYVESIEMKFDASLSIIKSFEIKSPSGFTLITFSDVKINTDIDTQLFN